LEQNYYDILITRKQSDDYSKRSGLKKALSGFYLWGIGVGVVIPGVFFGWNNGLEIAGPLGFLIATVLVSVYYIILVLIFSELSTRFPYAGGPYAYARKGLGPFFGYITGVLTIIEFVFAASAVTATFGNYINYLNPEIPNNLVVIFLYIGLIAIDIIGIRASGVLQLTFCIIAICALVIFMMGASGSINYDLVLLNQPFTNGFRGIILAIPFAMWFYVCIEAISLVSEETKNPEINIGLGFKTSIITVVVLSILILAFSLLTVNWVYIVRSNYPLTFILEQVQPRDKTLMLVFTSLGLCGLMAGLHGMIIGSSRQIFSLARAGYLPKFLSRIHPTTKAPYFAILIPALLGILLSNFIGAKILITITGYSALIMQALVFFSYIAIKNKESKNEKGKKLHKGALVWIAIAISLTILILFTLQQLQYIWLISLTLLIAALYYIIIGKNFIFDEAPEEIEAKLEKIYTERKWYELR
jgi:ethanolamine permease